ncbi:hypothetical protein ABW20_dc0105317 [Dactylellina cionopaga]|nr:hypothetical protein ABW20_dc0105317 [Dactylellina cionopaga]
MGRQSSIGLFFSVASLLPWRSLAAAPFVYQYLNDNAHIAYKGDVEISWKSFNGRDEPCTLTLGPQNHSWFFVGIHPDWDPNPLFFELQHISSTSCNSRGENCTDANEDAGGLFVYTNDDIYNLEFASSVVELNFDRGEDGDWELQRTVDFKNAKYSKTQLGGKDGYRVQLDKSSWLNNNTFDPSMSLDNQKYDDGDDDFLNDCHLDPDGTDFVAFKWTGIWDDFGVDFSFTNDKAKASFYVKANKTEMTLTFTGDRNISTITNERFDFPEIDLDTSGQRPAFSWRSGGAVDFNSEPPSETDGPDSTPTETESMEPTTSSTRRQLFTSTTSSSEEPTSTESDLGGTVSSTSATETTPTTSSSAPSSATSVPSSATCSKLCTSGWFIWSILILVHIF